MSAAVDTWGDEPQRRPVTGALRSREDYPTAREFLWGLVDLIGTEALYSDEIHRRLGSRSCKDRLTRSGRLHATLKALMRQGLLEYVVPVPDRAGKYRITAAGLAAVDRAC